MKEFVLRDIRSTNIADYATQRRRARFKQSWRAAAREDHVPSSEITLRDGLSWGSLGKIHGVMYGETSNKEMNRLYDRAAKRFVEKLTSETA